MVFSAEHLLLPLARCPVARRLWIAYSGGADSHVLLHAMAQIRPRLEAGVQVLHVNHQLQSGAAQWAEHCRRICETHRLPYSEINVDASPAKGESPEAAARRARYDAFTSVLEPGDGLLLAHHQNDQAETLLLQLLRGSGPRGLAAMPLYRDFGVGWIGRPLLNVPRQSLLDYARDEGLQWIEDPSNFDTDYDRNYLRRQILPPLQARWPALNATLGRAARHQAEVAELAQQIAAQDWAVCKGRQQTCLNIDSLLQLSTARRHNLLRYWISHLNDFPMPDSQRLQRIYSEVIAVAADAQPRIRWRGCEVRRYGGELFLLSGEKPADQKVYPWDLQQTLILSDGRRLQLKAVQGEGLKASLSQRKDLQIRFRQGGERCRPAGRGQTHLLKKLMQEWRIPPWQRAHIPLLYAGRELAAVIGYCFCEPFQAGRSETGVVILIQNDKPL